MKIKTSTYSFADYSASRRKIRSRFFNQINRLIDWEAVRRILDTARLKPKRKKDGRPAYDSLVLFRIELLRVWYGLSGDGASYNAADAETNQGLAEILRRRKKAKRKRGLGL